MIRTFTAAEVSSVYRVPLGTVYRLASEDKWRRSNDGKWPVLYNGDDVEATMEKRSRGGVCPHCEHMRHGGMIGVNVEEHAKWHRAGFDSPEAAT